MAHGEIIDPQPAAPGPIQYFIILVIGIYILRVGVCVCARV